ncbi:hypothetical protein DICA1_F13190 [Diutina catenulata]
MVRRFDFFRRAKVLRPPEELSPVEAVPILMEDNDSLSLTQSSSPASIKTYEDLQSDTLSLEALATPKSVYFQDKVRRRGRSHWYHRTKRWSDSVPTKPILKNTNGNLEEERGNVIEYDRTKHKYYNHVMASSARYYCAEGVVDAENPLPHHIRTHQLHRWYLGESQPALECEGYRDTIGKYTT